MKIKEVKSEGLNREYKVSVPSENFEKKVSQKLSEVSKKAKFPGFRPGKAPKAVVEKQYKSSVVGEALEEAVQDATAELIKSKNLEPATMPDVKISKFEEGKDIELDVKIEILPEIKLGDFSNLKLDKNVVEVSEEELEKALNYLAESRKETKKVEEDRVSKKDDTVVINFVGSVDGAPFQGGKGENHPLVLGSNSFIPGFEDQLIGKKMGEKVDVKVKFPDAYHAKDLAGQDSVFAVEIIEIRENIKAEVGEEFAKSLGEKSLAELKLKVSARIKADYEKASKMKLKRVLLDALDKEYSFAVPQSLLDQEYKIIVDQYENAKKHNQLDEEDKARSEKDILNEYKEIALRRVKLGLLLSAVSKTTKITVEPSDVQAAIMEEARKYPGQEQMVMEYYLKNEKAIDSLRAPIYEDKIIDFILEKVKLNEVIVSAEELYNFDSSVKSSKASTKKTAEKSTPKKEIKEKVAKK